MKSIIALVASVFAVSAFAAEPAKKDAKPADKPAAAAPAKDAKPAAAPAPAKKEEAKK